MLFTSLVFLFIFLPLVIFSYYLLPKQGRNYLLLLFSLIFYAWGGVSYSIILIGSILFNYLFVKQIEKLNAHRKKWLYGGLIFNVAILFVFKYLDFFIKNVNVLGTSIVPDFAAFPEANIVLPLGISFFTFQQMSLLWDVYRDDKMQTTGFLNTALYISFFPQLIAGPIVRYNDIAAQIKSRTETAVLMSSGIQKFILGLFKKVVIANSCGEIADAIMGNQPDLLTTPLAWLGIIAYTFQIYFDFSGYSDMAIGLGRIFGFRILENFNFPYISTSIKEFWRRWHISLSSWFRDYVYIPMGGNRLGPRRTYFNLFFVFILTGFWHGATWSFIFWGVFHGTFLIIERLGFDKVLDRMPKVLSWSYTMLVVVIGWVFFRIEAFGEAADYCLKLAGIGEEGTLYFNHYLNRERVVILALATLSCTTFFAKIRAGVIRLTNGNLQKLTIVMKNLTLLLILAYCVICINSGSYNPFIYFRF